MFSKKTIVCASVALSLLFVSPAAALSLSDIQSQIQSLLARIAELRKQAETLQSEDRATESNTFSGHRICELLSRNLAPGVRGNDVQELQEYLRSEGHLAAGPTGFYGDATRTAVAEWQKTHGLPAVGMVGPQSREFLKKKCGGDRLSIDSARGSVPHTVTFTAKVRLANAGFIADAGDYKIVFGDGSEYVFLCGGADAWCEGPHTVRHTYTTNGSYTAQLVHFGYFGIPGPNNTPPQSIVGTVRIVVGETACTKEYRPVCGLKHVVCITTPCNPVQQTYGNECTLKADGATFLHEGACRANAPENDPKCKAWFDGCNTCSRETPSAPSMCTLRACTPESMTTPYCTAYFDSAGNRPPSIERFSGPTLLKMGETGTWSISATDPEQGALSYSIDWGDSVGAYPSGVPSNYLRAESFVQRTTFEHSYMYEGVYTVTIVVRDSAGSQAKTTATVRVEGGDGVACTLEYRPVCATPYYCLTSKFSAGAYPRECEFGKTYGNTCTMNAEKAVYKYVGECQSGTVACTQEAKQCPDGSYVGRTGPNCEFSVCPATSCSFETTPIGSTCGGKYHCGYGSGGHYWSDTNSVSCSTAR